MIDPQANVVVLLNFRNFELEMKCNAMEVNRSRGKTLAFNLLLFCGSSLFRRAPPKIQDIFSFSREVTHAQLYYTMRSNESFFVYVF